MYNITTIAVTIEIAKDKDLSAPLSKRRYNTASDAVKVIKTFINVMIIKNGNTLTKSDKLLFIIIF